MSTTAKVLIEAFVKQYIITFPNEWASFVESMKENRNLTLSDYGEIKGSELVERKLFEMPETLYTILDMKLSKEDLQWFRSKDGAHWFSLTYPMFRSSKKF